jgi:hypothetical protein
VYGLQLELELMSKSKSKSKSGELQIAQCLLSVFVGMIKPMLFDRIMLDSRIQEATTQVDKIKFFKNQHQKKSTYVHQNKCQVIFAESFEEVKFNCSINSIIGMLMCVCNC